MTASAPQLTQLTIREVLKLKPVRRLWIAQVVSVRIIIPTPMSEFIMPNASEVACNSSRT